jgi:hypothetical protein
VAERGPGRPVLSVRTGVGARFRRASISWSLGAAATSIANFTVTILAEFTLLVFPVGQSEAFGSFATISLAVWQRGMGGLTRASIGTRPCRV